MSAFLNSSFEHKDIETIITRIGKKRNSSLLPNNIDKNLLIMFGGIAKVLVGELTEECMKRKEEYEDEDEDPITPDLLRQIYQEKYNEGTLPFIGDKLNNIEL